MTDQFVTYLVINRLVSHLTKQLQTNLSSNDPGRADVVKIGRFQDSPLPNKNIYITVSGGSQMDPELTDGIVTLTEFNKIGFYVPPREIGGGQMWWRRGEVRIGCFLGPLKLDETKSAELAYSIFGRLQASIETCRISDLKDSYGEQPINLYCFSSNFMESGGQGSYIWRGAVKWQFLTERP